MTQLEPIKLYLASPYSSSNKYIEEMRYAQVKLFKDSLMKGYYPKVIVYSPIIEGVACKNAYPCPTDIEYWWPLNKNFIDWCDWFAVYKLKGWKESVGVRREIDYALEKKKIILEFPA